MSCNWISVLDNFKEGLLEEAVIVTKKLHNRHIIMRHCISLSDLVFVCQNQGNGEKHALMGHFPLFLCVRKQKW